jgi:hypothetical protein
MIGSSWSERIAEALRLKQRVQRRSVASAVQSIESLITLRGDEAAEVKAACSAQVSGLSGSVDRIAEAAEEG